MRCMALCARRRASPRLIRGPRYAVALLAIMPLLVRSQVLIALILGDELNSGKIEFGLTTGMNASGMEGVDGARQEVSPYLGLYFDIRLSDKWYFHPETWPKCVLGEDKLAPYAVGDTALDAQLEAATVRRKIDCIPTSFMITRRFGQQLFVDVGPYGNLILGAKDIFTRETADDELTYTVKITDALHRVEIGGGLGARYKLSKGIGVNIGVHAFMGLTSVDKADEWTLQWVRASVGVPIGRGKAMKKEQEIAPEP